MENTTSTQDSTQQIAVEAYLLWESEGCQPGRDLEYWMRAKDIVGRRHQTQSMLSSPNQKTGTAKKTAEAKPEGQAKEGKSRNRKTAGALVE